MTDYPSRKTASCACGALTVTVGVLLLLTGGTTSLGGILGATRQAHLEAWVMRTTAGIPDLLVVLAAALVLALALARARTSGGSA